MIIVGRVEGLNLREEWIVQGKAVCEYGRHNGAPLIRKDRESYGEADYPSGDYDRGAIVFICG